MPLRISRTRSIASSVSGTRPFNLTTAPTRQPLSVPPLSVPLVAQKQTNWCWAACNEMVAKYYQVPSKEQCELATERARREVTLADCCDSTTPDYHRKCNQGLRSGIVDAMYVFAGLKCKPFIPNPIDSLVLQQKLTEGPVQVGYLESAAGNPTGKGHVVLVYGYVPNGGDPIFLVRDPGPVNSGSDRRCKYSELLQPNDGPYRGGEWSWKFTWDEIKKS